MEENLTFSEKMIDSHIALFLMCIASSTIAIAILSFLIYCLNKL